MNNNEPIQPRQEVLIAGQIAVTLPWKQDDTQLSITMTTQRQDTGWVLTLKIEGAATQSEHVFELHPGDWVRIGYYDARAYLRPRVHYINLAQYISSFPYLNEDVCELNCFENGVTATSRSLPMNYRRLAPTA